MKNVILKSIIVSVLIVLSGILLMRVFVNEGERSPTEAYTIVGDSTVVIHQNTSKPEYHIKVYHHWISYAIAFTNDNWETQYNLMRAFDISSLTDTFNVVLNPILESCEDAQVIARRFNTYEKAVLHNAKAEQEYKRLVEYRKSHPIIKQESTVAKTEPSCEKEIQIY